jgi:DNA-directed RNA polymerase subunit RPC12/RpoP
MYMKSLQEHQIDDTRFGRHKDVNEQLEAAGGMLGSSCTVDQRSWHMAHQGQSSGEGYNCVTCGKSYRWKTTLHRHQQHECGREPYLQCPYCPHRTKRNWDLQKHVKLKHLPENL